MNINKNKSICKGFVFSKTIFPAVSALLLVTQTGCIGWQQALGISEKSNQEVSSSLFSNGTTNNTANGYTYLSEDEVKPYMHFGKSVCSNAQKFVLFIPKLVNDGQPPVYPLEDTRAGQKILDYKGTPIDYNGLVFLNPTDQILSSGKG